MGYDKGLRTREEILDAAGRLIFVRGYGASSFSEITAALGISLGKITHHFPSKAALFEALFEQAVAQFRRETLPIFEASELTPLQRIEQVFFRIEMFYAAQGEIIGCPVGQTMADPLATTLPMRDLATALLADIERLLTRNLEEMGWSPAQASARAAIVTAAWQGAVLIARGGGGFGGFRRILGHVRTLLAEEPPR
ncbi:TetR/AcrR family transcriptional regulator [Ensifer sp. HO-A22]|uniref:TetR/AcrR family transcriptional regulator n=1 Tax=Ensifer oleiphilus TaxID=2742698 RepID=A0A7Y6QCK0_9HYPH|nr:TetR/AcrR family transcriptional regulator [Ensifer oleiphilus]NVD43121.1 TetR/AcrR family transcriptional regulator [Ensifer oleiphilus]